MTQKKLFDTDLTKVKLPTMRYIKHKLLAEEITVIKKALVFYQTGGYLCLEAERLSILSKLNHPDYFMCLFTAKRKSSVKKEKQAEKYTNPKTNTTSSIKYKPVDQIKGEPL
jgi:uncharacterized phage-like protein YoqJ